MGQNHADIGDCYNSIGTLHWYVREDYKEALSNLKKVVEIHEVTLLFNSFALAKTYHSIATTYDLTEQYNFSLEYYSEAFKIRQVVLPSNHPQIAVTYNNLGTLYESKGNYSKALEYYEKSINI